MKKFIGALIVFISIAIGFYVGGWCLFLKPILSCCAAFDAGTLTGMMVGITVLKCIFASFVGGLIVLLGSSIATFISNK